MFTGRLFVYENFTCASNQFQIEKSGGGQFAIGQACVIGNAASFCPAQVRVDLCRFGIAQGIEHQQAQAQFTGFADGGL